MKETINMIIVLVMVSLLSALSLSYAYDLTKDQIAENKLGNMKRTLNALVEDAIEFKDLEIEEKIIDGVTIEKSFNALSSDGSIISKVVISKISGYQSDIKVIFSYNSGTIGKVMILEQGETPGLGTRIEEESFVSQFSGKNKALEGVDTITGATISSAGVKKVIQTTLNNLG